MLNLYTGKTTGGKTEIAVVFGMEIYTFVLCTVALSVILLSPHHEKIVSGDNGLLLSIVIKRSCDTIFNSNDVPEKRCSLIQFCVHSSSDQPPTSFYLVRLISKTPCMVLRLGFPIGTPAHVRNKVLKCCRFSLNRVSAAHNAFL